MVRVERGWIERANDGCTAHAGQRHGDPRVDAAEVGRVRYGGVGAVVVGCGRLHGAGQRGLAPFDWRTAASTPRWAPHGEDEQELPRGGLVGRYVVLRRLGAGGMRPILAGSALLDGARSNSSAITSIAANSNSEPT